ncbi:LacI family DNA-binding transcriptional regulator [Raineyella sp. LH-20]|uniref:LacI family DNA-binding transcriptional regulator n=1 Tax=Raineyella sp. LH-20 TaxID=3081204 RepID=UPI00398570B6
MALRAGVSESTASRVMSASRPVGRETAARVRRAANELGYTGNSIARALRKSRTDTVGMVVPSILNPFFTGLVDSMERALHAEGKQLFLCDSRQDPEIEAEQLQSLLQRQVDGIVISACDQTRSLPALRAAADLTPLVQLDRRVDFPGADWIGVDDDEAMRLVLEFLHRSGVRSAAFVSSAMTNSSTSERLAGFRRHTERLGMEVREGWIVLRDYSIESGELAGQSLLDGRGPRPQSVVCADDLIAIGVLRACRRLGVRVPDQLQVTGFDDITFADYVVPSLTSVAQPTDRMASEALHLLQVASSRQPEDAGTRISLAPRLVLRETTAAAARRDHGEERR